ncbi:MAG TPA: hypothetical protein VF389_11695 [Woeseiaceae bacterium]
MHSIESLSTQPIVNEQGSATQYFRHLIQRILENTNNHTLAEIAEVDPTADESIYWSADDEVSVYTLTPFARTILDDPDAGTVRTTIGAIANVVEDATPQLGGNFDAQGNSITDLGNVTFQTGGTGGTLRTGTTAADKFELQAYDTDGGFYQKVLEADAGDNPTLEVFADSFGIWDNADETKRLVFALAGGATGVTTILGMAPTTNRLVVLPDANTILVGQATTDTLSNKTLTSPTINGGTFTGGTDIAVADGGTGASTAANARANLGAVGLTGDETIAGAKTFSSSPVMPGTVLIEAGAAADNGKWALVPVLGSLSLRAANDAETVSTAILNITRTGTTINNINFANGTLQQGGVNVVTVSGTQTLTNKTLTSPTINGGTFTGGTDIAIADGGTGASTAADARTNLGLGTIATQAANSVAITGGSVTGIADITVADGGTGASTASGARTNLGLVIGTNVEAAIAAGTTAQYWRGDKSWQTLNAAAVAGLGSLATLSSINNSNWSGTDLAVTNGGTGASDASGARTNLGLGTMATQAASAVAITGGSVTGITDLAVADGGTGASTAAAARTNLGAVGLTGNETVEGNKRFTGLTDTSRAANGQMRIGYDTGTDRNLTVDLYNGQTTLHSRWQKVGNAAYWTNEVVGTAFRLTTAGGAAFYDGATERELVNVSGTQTLTNKTLTSPTINGGAFTGGTDIAVADGGTGASDASGARTNLGLIIGTNVEASITAGTTAQYWRGDKSWQTLNAAAVGLGSVTNAAQVTLTGDQSISGRKSFTGHVNFPFGATLTIASGVITVSVSRHEVDTAGGADDLDTINGGSDGDILILSIVSFLRPVTLKSSGGNIGIAADVTLSSGADIIVLIKVGATWRRFNGA